jgi:hypothetical protein
MTIIMKKRENWIILFPGHLFFTYTLFLVFLLKWEEKGNGPGGETRP